MITSGLNNVKIGVNASQLGLCLLMAVVFAGLSYVIWLMRGKSSSYYISQYFALGFILLAMVFLFVKTVMATGIPN